MCIRDRYNLDLSIFADNIYLVAAAIVMVLIARAVSIYGTALITNNVAFFRDEPNIPTCLLYTSRCV